MNGLFTGKLVKFFLLSLGIYAATSLFLPNKSVDKRHINSVSPKFSVNMPLAPPPPLVALNPMPLAERVVISYHSNFQLNNFAGSYSDSSSSFKKRMSEAAFIHDMNDISKEFGAFKYGQQTEQSIRQIGSYEQEVFLRYRTVFANSTMDEHFYIEVKNGRAALKYYRAYDAQDSLLFPNLPNH